MKFSIISIVVFQFLERLARDRYTASSSKKRDTNEFATKMTDTNFADRPASLAMLPHLIKAAFITRLAPRSLLS